MKKYLLIFIFVIVSALGCSKKEDPVPTFTIEGKEYDAKWRINSQGRQEYVHISFGANGSASLWTSVEKILKYGDEKLSYTSDGNSYFIKGTLKESYWKPAGTVINWSITPTNPNGTIKSTFQFYELNFVAQ